MERDSLLYVGLDPDIFYVLIKTILALEQEMPTPQDLGTTPLDASYEFTIWRAEQDDMPEDVTRKQPPLLDCRHQEAPPPLNLQQRLLAENDPTACLAISGVLPEGALQAQSMVDIL